MTNKVTAYDHDVSWEEGNSVTQAYCVNSTNRSTSAPLHEDATIMVGTNIDATGNYLAK